MQHLGDWWAHAGVGHLSQDTNRFVELNMDLDLHNSPDS